MKRYDYPIFLSSADSYSDLWPLFFDLFQKYWPDFDGTIYLNTESLDFAREGLDIRCTKVGNLGRFGDVFRAGLEKVDSDRMMLFMIDYFLMDTVRTQPLADYYDYFRSNDLDSLCLYRTPYRETRALGFRDLEVAVPPSKDMFSFQVAFWKKSSLREMVLPHETPWLAEWYGTKRANLMGLRLAFPKEMLPVPYLPEGALHKGQWVKPMVEFLESRGIATDFSRRGFFQHRDPTLRERLKTRLKTLYPRVRSNLDLLRRGLAGKKRP